MHARLKSPEFPERVKDKFVLNGCKINTSGKCAFSAPPGKMQQALQWVDYRARLTS